MVCGKFQVNEDFGFSGGDDISVGGSFLIDGIFNEFFISNDMMNMDDVDEYDDWLELGNFMDGFLDLSGYGFIDGFVVGEE